MASDVTTSQPADAPLAPPAPPPVRLAGTPHFHRFFAIYALLGGALFAAIVLAVVYSTRTVTPTPPWSSWRPTGGGLGAAREIAARVAPEYRLAGRRELVSVITRRPTITSGKTSLPIRYIVTQGHSGRGEHVDVLSGSNSVMYTLCGLGASCTIATGKPSVARGTLVRREILELALYTFRYEPGVASMVAVMPPPSTTLPPEVIYLKRSDLASELQVPLDRTLSLKTPGVQTMTPREVRLVNDTLLPHAYSSTATRAQDGNALLLLTRPKA